MSATTNVQEDNTQGVMYRGKDLLDKFLSWHATKRQKYNTRSKASWTSMYEELQAYKQLERHCAVPTASTVLGRWVSTQRRANCKGTIAQDRKDLLNGLGFIWCLRKRTTGTKRSPKKKTIKGCPACGTIDVLRAIKCRYESCDNVICYKELADDHSFTGDMLKTHDGCAVICEEALEASGCHACPLYCRDHASYIINRKVCTHCVDYAAKTGQLETFDMM
eukprot:scaffold95997_cov45-Attheya_sp.AAC.1